MKMHLPIYALLLGLCAKCLTIEILVDNTATSRTRFCVGERLTLICSGDTGSYIWRNPPLLTGNQLLVSIGVMSLTINNFTGTFISMTESRLQFNVSSELNNTTISCFDPNLSVDVSTITLLLLGDVPAPSILSAVGTMESFMVTIMPPSINTICIKEYVVSVFDSDIIVYNQTILVPNGSETVVATINNMNNLRPCNTNYTFGARVSINMMYSNRVQGMVNFTGLGDISIITSPDNDKISWMPPAGLAGCSLSYEVSLQISDTSFTTSDTSSSKDDLGISSPCYYDIVTITPRVQTQGTPVYDSSATTGVSNSSVIDGLSSINDKTLTVMLVIQVGNCSDYFIQTMSGKAMRNFTKNHTMVSFSIQDNTECKVSIVSPEFGILATRNISCGTVTTTTMSLTTTTLTPIASSSTTTTLNAPEPQLLLFIVPPVVVVVIIVLIIVIIIITIVVIKKKKDDEKDSKPSKVETDSTVMMYEQDQTKATSHDVMPTYQDPQTIQREAAGSSGDVYTVVTKEKKGSKKKGQSEQLPMYSVVDKSAQKQEGLVYAEVDVQNSRSSRSRRPPAPPGVVQHDANEPVVYSTVDNTKI